MPANGAGYTSQAGTYPNHNPDTPHCPTLTRPHGKPARRACMYVHVQYWRLVAERGRLSYSFAPRGFLNMIPYLKNKSEGTFVL